MISVTNLADHLGEERGREPTQDCVHSQATARHLRLAQQAHAMASSLQRRPIALDLSRLSAAGIDLPRGASPRRSPRRSASSPRARAHSASPRRDKCDEQRRHSRDDTHDRRPRGLAPSSSTPRISSPRISYRSTSNGRRSSLPGALAHPRWPPETEATPDVIARKELVRVDEVRTEGTAGIQPAGEGHAWRKVSDHMQMGARPPEKMGYTPSFGGRQFHRRKSTIAFLDQPVGGRYQYEFLLNQGQRLEPRLEAGQTMPKRRSQSAFGHHFAYNGASPRGLPIKDDPYGGRRTADGYLTETDLRATRRARAEARPYFDFSEYRRGFEQEAARTHRQQYDTSRSQGYDTPRSQQYDTPRGQQYYESPRAQRYDTPPRSHGNHWEVEASPRFTRSFEQSQRAPQYMPMRGTQWRHGAWEEPRRGASDLALFA